MDAHKYSNATLSKIFGVMLKEIDEGRYTREELEGLIQAIKVQVEFRKLMIRFYELLLNDTLNPINDFPDAQK